MRISNWDKLIQAEARLKQLEEQQGNITTVDELKEALANAEEGDTLYLKGNIELTGSTTSPISCCIQSVTIEGNGYVIDGGEAFSLFQVTGGADLTLRNLTLRSAYRNANDSSGACAVAVTSGGITMENCVLTGNKSTYKKRGYIVYIAPSQKLIMKNCTVTGNENNNDDYSAIYIGRYASGVIANSVFGGNKSNLGSSNYDVYSLPVERMLWMADTIA